ncbi:hypothetical protein [Streptomyces sp. NPDC088196]|uniref:hypothetical protein n=1 Tax=Streptomyces sp. NPDC088196 TaxID=3154868 RepID=UPI00344E682B
MAEYEVDTEQLMRRVYLDLREDSLNPQDVVALACELLDWFHRTDAILEVVERNPAEVPPAEMTAEIEILEDWFPVGAGVRLADGERLNWGGPVLPNMCDDPTTALAGLAVLIQESLLERTWQVWPVCPRHGLGVHGSEREREAVWWCAGDGGHVLAPVGELTRALGRRRPK